MSGLIYVNDSIFGEDPMYGVTNYLQVYLDNNWKEILTRKITKYKDHTFMSHWIAKTIAEMIQDTQKLGIYPEIDFKSNPDKSVVEYEDFRQILGDEGTFIYKPVADWIEALVNYGLHYGIQETLRPGYLLRLEAREDSNTGFMVNPSSIWSYGGFGS